LLSTPQRLGRASLGLRPQPRSPAVDHRITPDPRARPEAESGGRPRAVRSGHALFRHQAGARPVAGLCQAPAREARGLSRRAHVLLARCVAAGLANRGRGPDETIKAGANLRGLHRFGRSDCSVDEARARRLVDGFGERAIFLALGADGLSDPVQMILRLLAVALLDLPQPIILPGLDVVRIGLQCALVPDLRELVVAELAVRVADQIGDSGAVVVTERLQL